MNSIFKKLKSKMDQTPLATKYRMRSHSEFLPRYVVDSLILEKTERLLNEAMSNLDKANKRANEKDKEIYELKLEMMLIETES